MSTLSRSALQFDSVVAQLQLLAVFLRCRDAADPRGAVLDKLAGQLGATPAPETVTEDAPGPAPEAPEPG